MELLLPQKQTAEKKYKHFIIESTPVKEIVTDERIDFIYIGTDSAKIDFLVSTFDGGYALDNIQEAVLFLKQGPVSQIVPHILIIEGKTDAESLKTFHKFLATSAAYIKTPVLLDCSDMTEEEVKNARDIQFIDEIVFIKNLSKSKLIAKVKFLRKIKSYNNTSFIKTNTSPSVNWLFLPLILKRFFDILVASIAIIALLPLLLIIAFLIKLESKGPVFYIARRAGKGFKMFNFYKFRTMVVDADKKVAQLSHLNQYAPTGQGPVFFKISNDPRITKVGAFLRNTSLDELPQLFNVLLGNMSLVGNRPLPIYEAVTLTTDEYAKRFMAPAGITGLWQIKKRGDSNMSIEERISLDIDYAKKISFIYDLWIIVRTPTALLQKENV